MSARERRGRGWSKGNLPAQERRHYERQVERRRESRQAERAEQRAIENEAAADADRRDRTCSDCGQVKPASDFYRDRTKAGGYQCRCKDCESDRQARRYAEQKRRLTPERERVSPRTPLDRLRANA